MKRKDLLAGFAAALGMLILILDGKTAMEGAQTGIDLCLKTVIPSLFPFFVLSLLLTSALSGTAFPILRPIQMLCGLGPGTDAILIAGFLGGYPVGAQSVAAAYRAGQIGRQEAQRTLAFCSNAGPAFLFGMVSAMFPKRWMAWALWLTHIVSALMVAKCIPGQAEGPMRPAKKALSVSQALSSSVRVMAVVCGWVILFRVLIAFAEKWFLWLFPSEIQAALTGLLELSNGCWELGSIADVRLRYLICSGILAFGGLCVIMQTAAVTEGLSLRYYLMGKLLQTVFSVGLSLLLCYGGWQIFAGFSTLMLILPGKNQKRGSFHGLLGV